MKKLSEKEHEYKKARHNVTILGKILYVAIIVSIFCIAVGISVFRTNYLYLAICAPIVLCITAILILLLHFFVKKERAIKSEIYNTNKLTTTNPLFQEVIAEYYDNQLESLEHLLPKKWKVIDIDAYNNSIIICIRKQSGMQIEVEISETDISVMGEDANSEEEISIVKNLTSENFSDFSSVLIYIANTCEKINEC